MAAAKVQGITIQLGADTSKLASALRSANSEIKNTERNLKGVESALKMDPTSTNLLKDKQKFLGDQVTDTEAKLKTLKEAQSNLDPYGGTEKQKEQYNALQIEIDETEAKLKSAKDELKSFGSVGAQQIAAVGEKVKGLGETIADVGGKLTTHVTVPLVAAAGAAIKTGADFEQGMAQVQAISGATGEDLEALEQKARDLGASTEWSASQVAEGLKYMSMAGWKTNDMLSSIAGVMDLATASGEDLGTVSDIVTDAMTAFGLAADGTSTVIKDGLEIEVDNATRFVDVLAAAASNSNTNVSMLGESFKFAAPLAGSMGYTIEDTAVALGLMANSGIKATQAGTSLRNIITRMAAPTKQSGTAMDTLGLTLANTDGSMKSLMEVMEDLRTSFNTGVLSSQEFQNGLTQLDEALSAGSITEEEYEAALEKLAIQYGGVDGAQQAALASMLAGKQGLSGLLAIVNTSDEDFNKLVENINGSNGACETMAGTMRDTTQGSIAEMKSKLEELALNVFDVLQPAFLGIIEAVNGVIDGFNNMDPETQKVIVTALEVAAVLGPILLIGGKLIIGIGTLMTLAPALSAEFTALTGPIGVVMAVIAALITVGIALYENWGEICDWASALKERVVGQFETLKTNCVEAFEQTKTDIVNAWDTMKQSVIDTVDNLKNGIKEKFDWIKEKISDEIDAIKGFLNFEWSFPPLKLPHFSIQGSFSLSPPSVPSIGIDWYDKGGIFSSPSIIGVGEKRPEFVGALDDLRDIVREEAGAVSNKEMIDLMKGMLTMMQTYMPQKQKVYMDGREVAELIDERLSANASSEEAAWT